MNDHTLYASAWFGVALGFFIFGSSYMFRKTRLDVFRSSLFAIRDQMFFDMARRGKPSDCVAYQRLRDEINGTIRFAHQLDLLSLMIATLAVRNTVSRYDLLDVIQAEPDHEAREYLLGVYRKVARRTMRYTIFEGPQVLFTVPLMMALSLWKGRGRWVKELPPELANRLASLGQRDSREARLLLGA